MLDKKDSLILKELDKNARQSNTQIAKRVSLSKETVNYRIKKLEKEHILQGYFPLINYFQLGKKLFKILIRFQNTGQTKENIIIKWLTKNKNIIWTARTEGKWDLIATVETNVLDESLTLLTEFKSLFSKNIQETQILLSFSGTWFNEKYLYANDKEQYKTELKKIGSEIFLDDKDERIIKAISKNARMPLLDISQQIRLTPEATSKRIKNLEKQKILKHYKPRLNFDKLKLNYYHIFISLKDYSKMDELTTFYENSPFCTFLMKHHGNYDLHLEIVANQEDYRIMITELREKFGNIIRDYQPLIIFKEFKILDVKN